MFNLLSFCSIDLKTRCRSTTHRTVVLWASAIASTRPLGHSVPQCICASNTDASSFDRRVVLRDISDGVILKVSTPVIDE